MILSLIGLGFLTPVLIDYVKTGLVPKMPSFVASVFFFIGAVQAFFGGLILDNIIRESRRNFEINLNNYADRYRKLKSEEDKMKGKD